MTFARCRNDVSGQVPAEGTARLCPHRGPSDGSGKTTRALSPHPALLHRRNIKQQIVSRNYFFPCSSRWAFTASSACPLP
jgi:hypothetical protein